LRPEATNWLTLILTPRKISLVQKGTGKKGDRKGLGFAVKSVTYINKSHNKNFPKWGEIGGFQVFFLILGANACFWVKNGGRCVNMRIMGNVGNKKTSIN